MNFKFYPLSQSVCKLLAEHKILHLVNWWMFYKFFQFMLSINSETPFIIFILSRSFLDQCLSLPVKSLVVASASQQLITHYPAPSLSDWHYFVICHITIYKQLFYCQFTEIDLCAIDFSPNAKCWSRLTMLFCKYLLDVFLWHWGRFGICILYQTRIVSITLNSKFASVFSRSFIWPSKLWTETVPIRYRLQNVFLQIFFLFLRFLQGQNWASGIRLR